MSKVCQLSRKKKSTGFNVSHSNRHTKRTFDPNVTKRVVIDPVTGTKLRINVSTRALRTMIKNPGKFRVEIASLVKKQAKKATKMGKKPMKMTVKTATLSKKPAKKVVKK